MRLQNNWKGLVNTMAKVTALQVLKDAAALKEKKSADYQGGLFTEEDYFPFGEQSYVHMLWTKMLRLRSVLEQDNPNFESCLLYTSPSPRDS